VIQNGRCAVSICISSTGLKWLCRQTTEGDWHVAVSLRAGAAPDDPIAQLLGDHRCLNALAARALDAFDRAAAHEQAQEGADICEAAILCGMLSGLMAKHEHREKSQLLPLWQAALSRLPANDRLAIARQVRERVSS
jgi:hypothetical protein